MALDFPGSVVKIFTGGGILSAQFAVISRESFDSKANTREVKDHKDPV